MSQALELAVELSYSVSVLVCCISLKYSSTEPISFSDNPGPWFLHCHIDWHLVAGLAVVFAEDPEAIRQTQIIKPVRLVDCSLVQCTYTHAQQEWAELCDIYNALAPELQ